MPLLTLQEGGGGTEVEVRSARLYFEVDGEELSPAVVTQIEIENDGDTSRTQDQCGRTERKRVGDRGWVVRVQGIVTGNDARSNNLSLQKLKQVASRDEVRLVSPLIDGTFVVSNTVITQSNNLVSINTPRSSGDETAFEFQIQLGEEDSG